MATLVLMSDSEYAAYVEAGVPRYAAEKVASGQWSPAESLALSRMSLDELLPQGRHTPGNHLFTILDGQSAAVGMLWIAEQIRAEICLVPKEAGNFVFSTGSIMFCGSLPVNGFDNNISRLLENVVRRCL